MKTKRISGAIFFSEPIPQIDYLEFNRLRRGGVVVKVCQGCAIEFAFQGVYDPTLEVGKLLVKIVPCDAQEIQAMGPITFDCRAVLNEKISDMLESYFFKRHRRTKKHYYKIKTIEIWNKLVRWCINVKNTCSGQ